jgi:hypothetical protein
LREEINTQDVMVKYQNKQLQLRVFLSKILLLLFIFQCIIVTYVFVDDDINSCTVIQYAVRVRVLPYWPYLCYCMSHDWDEGGGECARGQVFSVMGSVYASQLAW